MALRSFEATKRLLETSTVRHVLGSDEPAAPEDFSHIRVRYQPPTPRYPPEAKVLRIQGTVVVEVTQDQEGRVIKVHAMEGPKELQPTSEAYAACWRFYPIPASRKEDRLTFRLTMPFRLR